MNTKTTKYAKLLPFALLATLPASVLAGMLTVNTTTDPEYPSSANCSGAAPACSLREALLAADENPDHDVIVFDVDETIYLTRKLTAQQPVTIDGGGDAHIRIHQGYSIATLPDKFSDDIVAVLQPTWRSIAAGRRYMLELSGSGSAVLNLEIDGSITPVPGEVPVERVDYNSDGVTDYVLNSVDSDDQSSDDDSSDDGDNNDEQVWPVAGGVLVDFSSPVDCLDGPPLGVITISGNELKNLANNAITVSKSYQAKITDNEVSGGAYPAPGFNSDGISLYCGAAPEVSDNEVTGYRNGITLSFTTAASITSNEVAHNRTGIELEFANADLAPNTIADNEIEHNLQHGITLYFVSGTNVTGNEVEDNGTNPDEEGGILVLNSGQILFEDNEAKGNSGFGIAIDGSWFNQIVNNEFKKNGGGGGGVVLVNDSQFNTVASNKSKKNSVGIISAVTIEGSPFPSNNLIEFNKVKRNSTFDMLDFDPDCNDVWNSNKFATAYAASGVCIQ